jgi:LacI family transcriptional regulator
MDSRGHPTESAARRRTGMKEVAEYAGVALSSVSRVLSGHPDVSEPMRRRVMAAVDELDYSPDLLAQGLRSRTTYSVGFAVANISNPVLAAAVQGAERALRAAGYSLLLTDSGGDPSLDAAQIQLLQRRRVDGLLLSLADEEDPETAAVLRSVDAPIVLVDRDLPAGLTAPRALFDHRRGMRQAGKHLVDLGHRDVALIIGGPRRPARERRKGLESALRRAGARCSVFEGGFSLEHGYQATTEILARSPRPTAIVAGGNLLMHGALRALAEAGVQLGADISFVGCDDVAVAEFHRPAIAVVERNEQAMGEAAAGLLLQALDERRQEPIEDVTLPTEFLDRPSCAPPPASAGRQRRRGAQRVAANRTT